MDHLDWRSAALRPRWLGLSRPMERGPPKAARVYPWGRSVVSVTAAVERGEPAEAFAPRNRGTVAPTGPRAATCTRPTRPAARSGRWRYGRLPTGWPSHPRRSWNDSRPFPGDGGGDDAADGAQSGALNDDGVGRGAAPGYAPTGPMAIGRGSTHPTPGRRRRRRRPLEVPQAKRRPARDLPIDSTAASDSAPAAASWTDNP